jgi:hypothetical protein
MGVRHRDGGHRRVLPRLPAGHRGKSGLTMPGMGSIDAEAAKG